MSLMEQDKLSVRTRRRFSKEFKAKAEGFPTVVSCRIAGVGRQAFYDWSDRQERGSSLKELATAELVDEIRRIHSDSGGAYGSPRVTAVLRRQGRRVNHKRVERLMRVNRICGIYKRRKPRFRPAALDRPLQHPQNPLHPQLPDPHRCASSAICPTAASILRQQRAVTRSSVACPRD